MINKSIVLGIYEKALPGGTGWYERLATAKEAGFDFVEISVDETDERLARLDWSRSERREFCDAIAETGVYVPTMCLSGHRRFPLGSENPETRAKGLDMLRKAIELAADTGIRTVQLAGYDVYYETSNDKTLELFKDGLRQGIAWAERMNVMLAVEIMDTQLINSITKGMAYVNEFNSHCFKVYPDIGNLSAWGNDIEAEFDVGKGHMVAIHVKDTRPGVFKNVPFGEGTVDFVTAFRKLRTINYQGPFLIEMWTETAADPIQEVKNARTWVLNKMQEAGWNTQGL